MTIVGRKNKKENDPLNIEIFAVYWFKKNNHKKQWYIVMSFIIQIIINKHYWFYLIGHL